MMCDVWSHFGWFGLRLMPSVGSSWRVWAFEPQQFLCGEIRRSAARDGFDHQFVRCKSAVGETNHEATFTSDCSGSHALCSMYQPGWETEGRIFSFNQITRDHAAAKRV